MNILVVGGNGFVGKSVVELLNSSQHRVDSYSRHNGLDLRDYESTLNVVQRCKPDIIINCAAHVGSLHYVTTYAGDVVDDNMRMILNIYRTVKEIVPHAKIINPIANCLYPGESSMLVESQLWDGPVHRTVIAYAHTRRMQLVIAECYRMQYQIKSLNFIVPNCYGPGDSIDPQRTHALNGMIIRMIQAKRACDKTFEIWGSGEPIREWIYVKDLARALLEHIDVDEDQTSPINIAQNKAYSIRETAEMIKDLIGYKGQFIFNTQYPDGAHMKKLDDTLFRSKFPAFIFTEIHQGIQSAVDYFEDKIN